MPEESRGGVWISGETKGRVGEEERTGEGISGQAEPASGAGRQIKGKKGR